MHTSICDVSQASGITTAALTSAQWLPDSAVDGVKLKYVVVLGSFVLYAVMVTLQVLSIRRFEITRNQFNAKIAIKDSNHIDIMAGIISFDKLFFRREDLIG